LPVGLISAGVIDRAIDRWERDYGRSTVKNTFAPLVLVLDEAVRDGLITSNPAKDRARRTNVSRSFGNVDSGPSSPRDLALPDVDALHRLVAAVVESGAHQCWGDMVTILATTAMRISEVSGLRIGDVDLGRGVIHVSRQTYPGRGASSPRRPRVGDAARCRSSIRFVRRWSGSRSTGVPTTDCSSVPAAVSSPPRPFETPRTGTSSSRDSDFAGLVRHGLRHTALTWMADAGVPLHVLQRVAGHQDPAVTTGYLHPDVQATLDAGVAYSAFWARSGPDSSALRLVDPAPGVREQGL